LLKKINNFLLGKKKNTQNFQYYIIEKRKKNPGSSDLFIATTGNAYIFHMEEGKFTLISCKAKNQENKSINS
jgi:hypothetical protein